MFAAINVQQHPYHRPALPSADGAFRASARAPPAPSCSVLIAPDSSHVNDRRVGRDVGSKSRCPVLFTHDLSGFSFQPVDPRRLADGGFRFLVRWIGIVVGAAEKWESLFLGISKGRWEPWKTGVWFSRVSTGPAFPRLSGCGLSRSGCPSAV